MLNMHHRAHIIGMANLNDSPADPRPLNAADLLPWQRTGAHAGVQPAEAATEVGQEDDLGCARGVVYAIPAALLAWAAIAAAAVAWKFWPL